MKYKINSYLAILLITIAGAGAALLLMHVATSDTFAATFSSGATKYDKLQKSIPGQ
jgi:hypothetical protein